jgi:hypothetical protein
VTIAPGRPHVQQLVLLAAALAIYVPAVGHGFVKDDFGWIASSSLSAVTSLDVLTSAPTGFYRPAVSVSFALNRALCGVEPLCYGATNLTLLLAAAAGVFALARSLGMAPAWATVAAAIWIFNWHGINMATIWISGRTALLLTLFAVWGSAAILRGWWTPGACLVLLAMLAKEEAVLLPVVLLCGLWLLRLGDARPRQRTAATAGLVAAWAAYLGLRLTSGAFTPETAPPFYRLEVSLSRFLDNFLPYLDRSSAAALAAVVLFALASRPARLEASDAARRTAAFALVWTVLGFAITIFLPVRSSLYACFPSVGSAIAASILIASAWPAVPAARRRLVLVGGLLLPFALWPLFNARNRGSVREAELSHATIVELQRVARDLGAGTVVRLSDDRTARPSFDAAFGTGVQGAADLMVSPRLTVWIDPPPRDAALAGLESPGRSDVTLTLENGAVRRSR